MAENGNNETWEDTLLTKCRPYKYGQLHQGQKTIRLFKILNRGIFQDAIFVPTALERERRDPAFRLSNEQTFCTFIAIQEFKLEEAPDFSTLSYCWGDVSVRRPIFISYEWSRATSADPTAYLHVSENLYRAIRQIVIPVLGHDGWLWADAISIDQEDDHEKAWQVNMMWHIYNRSNQTLCWLGEGENGEDELVDSLFPIWNKWRQDPAEASNEDRLTWCLQIDFDLQALKRLVELPYWQRAWVQQEVNAQTFSEIWFMCGRKKTHINMFALLVEGIINRAHQILEDTQDPTSNGPTQWENDLVSLRIGDGFERMNHLIRTSPTDAMRHAYMLHQWFRLMYLLGSGVEAKDGRDLLFSLYNMSREREADMYKADYTKTCAEVYIETAKTFSDRHWSSVLLYRNDPVERAKDEASFNSLDDRAAKQRALTVPCHLPTWVPNWRSPVKPVHILRLPLVQIVDNRFSAGKRRQDTEDEESEHLVGYFDNKMLVNAVRIGKVMKISAPMKRTPDHSDLETAQEWLGHLDRITKYFAIANVFRQSVEPWKVPILDAEIASDSRTIQQSTTSASRSYDTLKRMRAAPIGLGNTTLQPEVIRYCEVLLAACENKSFFVTNSGYIGLGFTSVAVGDVVAVMDGVSVPMVLRSGPEHDFLVISDAFVDGVMYGEVWRGGPRVERLQLC